MGTLARLMKPGLILREQDQEGDHRYWQSENDEKEAGTEEKEFQLEKRRKVQRRNQRI